MQYKPLWRLSVRTTGAAEEAVAALLEGIFDQPTTTYLDERSKSARISMFSEVRPEWTSARRAAFRLGLEILRQSGLDCGSCRATIRLLPGEDWAESWKKHFHPIEAGTKLLIKPTWERQKPHRGQQEIILDPGLSFGTGNHPTTLFCLQQLADVEATARVPGFLDIGTGSGILAIAAAKLGFQPVHAFDFDPDAVRIARVNARRNGVLDSIRFKQADLKKLPLVSGKKYQFICANLLADILYEERQRIVNRLAPGGTLVLAGILREEFAKLRDRYERARLILKASRTGAEWTSGAFYLATGNS